VSAVAAALGAPKPACADDAFVKDPSFYGRWSYAEPADIVPFVEANAAPGDAKAVLAAMDAFGRYYPMYKLGDEKGRMLAELVTHKKPRNSVEVGTFLGYSAIWTAINLPPGGKLTCVEFEPRHVAVARALTSYAGVSDRVEILQGSGADKIQDVVARLSEAGGEGTNVGADMVFFDHCKECYLPDLISYENAGIIREDTVVVADNVVYPGAPDFLEYVDTARGRYRTELLEAAFEYDQVWKKDWVPQRDALSFSTRLKDAIE
jgi:predicted O-methyltransferase YrrM